MDTARPGWVPEPIAGGEAGSAAIDGQARAA
jgi:hypothetical protein